MLRSMRDLSLLPKAHLHVHLESTIRREALRVIGDRNGVTVPDGGGAFGGFGQFAAHNELVRNCLRRPEDFTRIAAEFCADEAADGTRYAEVTFTAAAHGERLGQIEMPLEAVLAGLAEGQARHDVECQVILVCPSSNVALGFVPTFNAHPLPRLRDAGLAVTVNTDIPVVIGTSPATEYTRVTDAFGYDDAVLADLAQAAIDASFAPAATRKRLRERTDAWLAAKGPQPPVAFQRSRNANSASRPW